MSQIPVFIVEEDIQFAGKLLVQINNVPNFYCAKIFKLNEFLLAPSFEGIIILSCSVDMLTEKHVLTIQHTHPEAAIVLYKDMFALDEMIRYIKLGIHGFYDMYSNHVEAMLVAIEQHKAFISPRMVPRIFEYFNLRKNLISNLTKKEKEIFYLLKDGHTYDEIAKQCAVSINTVRFHIKSLYRKFNVKTKVQLINTLEIL